MTMTNQNTNPYPWRTQPQISPTRQQFLTSCLATPPDIQQGIYPFKDIKLTRADIEWLLATHQDGRGPIDWSDEQQRERLGLDLRGADLRHVNLSNLPLARMCGGLTMDEWLTTTTPEQRYLANVYLEGADLSEAHLEGAILRGAYLEGATLRRAYLQEAILYRARLSGAYFRKAHLEQVNLRGADLRGAYLRNTSLAGADLCDTFFNAATDMEGVVLGDQKFGFVSLADVHWGDVNLSVVDWTWVKILGDEQRARQYEIREGTTREKARKLELYRAAVRANRQLANTMRAQGMNEEAVPFAYRAQVLQRKVLWRQVLWGQAASLPGREALHTIRHRIEDAWWRMRKYGAYIFLWFLDVLAGYGYKPGRSVLIYLLVLTVFATCYSLFGHLSPMEALIFSVTSFHGRGFLPGPFTLSNPVTALAALEAVMGLFIEISFIATFTQRFFGR